MFWTKDAKAVQDVLRTYWNLEVVSAPNQLQSYFNQNWSVQVRDATGTTFKVLLRAEFVTSQDHASRCALQSQVKASLFKLNIPVAECISTVESNKTETSGDKFTVVLDMEENTKTQVVCTCTKFLNVPTLGHLLNDTSLSENQRRLFSQHSGVGFVPEPSYKLCHIEGLPMSACRRGGLFTPDFFHLGISLGQMSQQLQSIYKQSTSTQEMYMKLDSDWNLNYAHHSLEFVSCLGIVHDSLHYDNETVQSPKQEQPKQESPQQDKPEQEQPEQEQPQQDNVSTGAGTDAPMPSNDDSNAPMPSKDGTTVQSLAEAALREFAVHVEPYLQRDCRKGLIHGDCNDFNILMESMEPTVTGQQYKVAAFLDFEDLCYSYMIHDLAITMAYMMMGTPDPIALGSAILAGFHSIQPLSPSEIQHLARLIKARIAFSLVQCAKHVYDNTFVQLNAEDTEAQSKHLCDTVNTITSASKDAETQSKHLCDTTTTTTSSSRTTNTPQKPYVDPKNYSTMQTLLTKRLKHLNEHDKYLMIHMDPAKHLLATLSEISNQCLSDHFLSVCGIWPHTVPKLSTTTTSSNKIDAATSVHGSSMDSSNNKNNIDEDATTMTVGTTTSSNSNKHLSTNLKQPSAQQFQHVMNAAWKNGKIHLIAPFTLGPKYPSTYQYAPQTKVESASWSIHDTPDFHVPRPISDPISTLSSRVVVEANGTFKNEALKLAQTSQRTPSKHTMYRPIVFDYSGKDDWKMLRDVVGDSIEKIRLFNHMIFSGLVEYNSGVAWGRWGENRVIYQSDLFVSNGTARSLHMGVDIGCTCGTPLTVPMDGIVHSIANNDSPLDYGPTIILEHTISDPEDTNIIWRFYTLYGHLSKSSILKDRLVIGQTLSAGDLLGWVGEYTINGGWPSHLHFQVMLEAELGGRTGDYPGVCTPSDWEEFQQLLPNPDSILRFGQPRTLKQILHT